MSAVRPALLIATLLLGGCASPAHQQLGAALSGLEGELTRLEEELAAMNGLHYQKAIDAPVALRRYLKAPAPTWCPCRAGCKMALCCATTTGCPPE